MIYQGKDYLGRPMNYEYEDYKIFKLQNIISGKSYIGRSLLRRGDWRNEDIFIELRRGCHPIKDLQDDFNKYGLKSFTWDTIENVTDWKRHEQNPEREWMIKLKTYDRNYGYNTECRYFNWRGRPTKLMRSLMAQGG